MGKLLFDVFRTKEESDRITDFVAIGYLHDDEYPHAGIVIKYQKNIFQCDFNGYAINYMPLSDDYFHKITDLIDPDEVPSFIAHCKNVKKNGNPLFDYFYSGESYDLEGNHKSNTNLGERMTCVGFCLNIFKGFLEEDYLCYEDWTSSSYNDSKYLISFCQKTNIDIESVINHHRRITPLELLVSAFFTAIPIKKHQIDNMISDVEENILRRL